MSDPGVLLYTAAREEAVQDQMTKEMSVIRR